MNAFMERFVKSIKHESTDQLILFSERSLRRVISESIEFYNGERFHQGMGNQLLAEPEARKNDDGEVSCRERLGGLLRYYYRQAA